MSNSTVSLYNLLEFEFPGQVYNGQIGQSVNLQSTNGVILLTQISAGASKNKDNAKRDQIVYNIDIIGILQKTVDSLAEQVRNLVEPYTDEYIYLMEYDGMVTNRDYEVEAYQKVLTFNCWPNTDGLNQPVGTFEYYEHYVRFYNDNLHEILNETSDNYFYIKWSYSNFAFHATHHITPLTDIDVFRKMVNYAQLSDRVTYYLDEFQLTIINEETGHTMDDVYMLIRVPRNIVGSFNNLV